jgi:hypothetical protein
MKATVRYAESGPVHVAYQVFGDGAVDLVFVPGFISHLEHWWSEPAHARWLRRLGECALNGGMDEPEMKIIDVFVCKLRKKLANASGGKDYIETVWGRGYVMRELGEVAATISA